MNTIKQKTATVTIEGGPGAAEQTIEVRRMRWKAAREFLRKLAGVVTQLIHDGKLGQLAAAEGLEKLNLLDVLAGQLPAIVEQSEELIMLLVTQSTSLTAEQFDALDALAASEVLNAALGVNCDDDLKNSWAGIAAKLTALMPAAKVVAQAQKTS
jgi:hypothetical protein